MATLDKGYDVQPVYDACHDAGCLPGDDNRAVLGRDPVLPPEGQLRNETLNSISCSIPSR